MAIPVDNLASPSVNSPVTNLRRALVAAAVLLSLTATTFAPANAVSERSKRPTTDDSSTIVSPQRMRDVWCC
ncbi:hypothetical protein GCM10027273_08810 [Nocardioides pakistanensis]